MKDNFWREIVRFKECHSKWNDMGPGCLSGTDWWYENVELKCGHIIKKHWNGYGSAYCEQCKELLVDSTYVI